MVLILQ